MYSRAAFDKLSKCHTAGIGVHQFKCNNAACAIVHQQYHSCRTKMQCMFGPASARWHCPNCGGMRREQWIQERMNELLPTTYFHVVFTLPQELRSITMGNMRVMYALLFEAAHYAINKLSADNKWMGAKPGIISVLHTCPVTNFHNNVSAWFSSISYPCPISNIFHALLHQLYSSKLQNK